MLVKQLNSINPFLLSFQVKNINNLIKFSHQPLTTINLQQKSFRSYVSINNNNNHNNNNSLQSSPLLYNNNNNNNIDDELINKMEFSSEMIELLLYRLRSGGKLNYKFT